MNTPNANQVHITILDRDKIIESGTCSLAYVLFRVLNASQQVVSVEFNYTLALYTSDDDIIRVASPERDVLERILTAHQDSTGDVAYDWMRFFGVSHGTAFKFRHVAQEVLLGVKLLADTTDNDLEKCLLTNESILK